jgi:hypothetical protein
MGNNWIMQYYFIAFIDVLGQSQKLLNLTRLPITKEEQEKAALILHNTAGNIMSLRKGFLNFFKARNKSNGIFDSLSPDKRAIAEKIRRAEAIITSFSDTIVIAVPLSNEDDHCLSINSIDSALYGICGMFLVALAQQKPFRCGVDVGLGVRLTEREVYGPALVKAHSLENDVALYPRIVIGDSLFEYLNVVQQLSSNTIEAKFAKKIAGDCKALITHDYDKLKILDVIGEGAQSIPGGIDKSLVEKAYRFIVQSHDTFTKSADIGLRARYGLLRSYFESRIDLWNIQSIHS